MRSHKTSKEGPNIINDGAIYSRKIIYSHSFSFLGKLSSIVWKRIEARRFKIFRKGSLVSDQSC